MVITVGSVMVVLLLFVLATVYESLTVVSPANIKRANFHKVLEVAGKTVFRPGGAAASERLHSWGHIGPKSQVLEVAGGVGTGAIALARSTGCHVLTTDLDKSRLPKAIAYAAQCGVGHLVSVGEANMFDVKGTLKLQPKHPHTADSNQSPSTETSATTVPTSESLPQPSLSIPPSRFDAVLAEATLTHHSRAKKVEFFRQVRQDLLRTETETNNVEREEPGHLLLHEICLRGGGATSTTKDTNAGANTDTNAGATTAAAAGDAGAGATAAMLDQLQSALGVGFHPEPVSDWTSALAEAGFTITQQETGPIRLLDPPALIRDEGLLRAVGIMGRLLLNKELRMRMLRTRSLLNANRDRLGYILIAAVPVPVPVPVAAAVPPDALLS